MLDGDGKTPLLVAVEALMLGRGNVPRAALDTVNLLYQRGANEHLQAIKAFLGQQPGHPASGPLLGVFSNRSAQEAWRKSRDDSRMRRELDLSPEQFLRARESVEALRKSGRFIDYYVAYGVTRNIEDIKRAQSLASSTEEYFGLEHMAVMTVVDPAEIVEPTFSVQRDDLGQFTFKGKPYSAIRDIGPDHDLSFMIKLRQTPNSRIHLSFASYLATVHIVMSAYTRTADGVDMLSALPAVIPVAIRIVPANYIGAGIVRLSDFKDAIVAQTSALGGDTAFSRNIELRLIRLERVE